MEESSPKIVYSSRTLRDIRRQVTLPTESPLADLYGNIRQTPLPKQKDEARGPLRTHHTLPSANSTKKAADEDNWRARGKPDFVKAPATAKRPEKSQDKPPGRESRKKDSLWDDEAPVLSTSRAEQERILFEQERAEFLANRVHVPPVEPETDLEVEMGSSILQLRDEVSPRSEHTGMKSMTVSQLLRRHSQNKGIPPPPPDLPYPVLDINILRHPPEIADESDMKWLNEILDMPHTEQMHESPRSARREKSILSHLSEDEFVPTTPPQQSRHFPTNTNSDALTSLLGLGQKSAPSPRDTGTRVAVSSLFSAASAQGGVMASDTSAPVIVNHTDVLSVLGFNAPPSPPRNVAPPAAASPSFVFHKSGGSASPAVEGSGKKPAISAASRLQLQRILQSEKKRSAGEKASPASASKSAQLVAAISAKPTKPPSSPAIVVSNVPPFPSTAPAAKPGMKKINLNSIFSAAASAPNKTLQVGK